MSGLDFTATGANVEPYAAVPTIAVHLRIADRDGEAVQSVNLRILIQIEATRRGYSDAEVADLQELFGPPHNFAKGLRSVPWTQSSVVVPAFAGSTEIDIPLTGTYDFDVVAAKYLHALDGGDIPLVLMFSGTVFRKGPNGFALEQIPWSSEAKLALPVTTWRALMDAYFPDSAWLRLGRDTLAELGRYKAVAALPTWDAVFADLLAARAVTEGSGS